MSSAEFSEIVGERIDSLFFPMRTACMRLTSDSKLRVFDVKTTFIAIRTNYGCKIKNVPRSGKENNQGGMESCFEFSGYWKSTRRSNVEGWGNFGVVH